MVRGDGPVAGLGWKGSRRGGVGIEAWSVRGGGAPPLLLGVE